MEIKERNAVMKNYLYSLSYQILILVLPLATIPYLTRILGKVNLGVFDYIQAITSYFVLFGCMGISLYGQREIACAKDNPEKRSRLFIELVLLRLITVAASFVIFYTAIIRPSEFPKLYMVFAVELLSAVFDISWFYQGMENFRAQTIRNFAVKIIGMLLIFFFVKTENDLTVYIICYTVTTLLGNLSFWLRLPKYLVRVSARSLSLVKHISPAFVLFLPQIATSVYTQLDKTMIGLLYDYDQVAYYSYSEKIVKISLTIVTSLNLVMLSRIANLNSTKGAQESRNAVVTSFRFSSCLAFPIMFGVAALAKRFVPWFFGAGWETNIVVMIVLSPIVVFIGLSGVFGVQYLLPTKRMKLYTLSIFSGTLTNLILNFVLIPRLGAIGAAVATVIAEMVVLAVQMISLRKEFSLKIIGLTAKYFIAGAIMGVIVYFTGELLQRRMGGTLMQVLVGVAVYFLLLCLFRDSFFLRMLREYVFKKKPEDKG